MSKKFSCLMSNVTVLSFIGILVICIVSCKSKTLQDVSVTLPDVELNSKLVSYENDIQPIFDRKCISCHSCFDAPAQLNLSCSDGVLRGATKQVVYDGTRLHQVQPTRMHADAVTEDEWRKLGFFSVLGSRDAETAQERLQSSILYRMIAQSRFKRVPLMSSVESLVKDPHDPAKAPELDELPDFFDMYPHAGMPYFVEGLTDEEFGLISNWIVLGSPIEKEPVVLNHQEKSSVQQWETLLNQSSIKSQLIARYLYEHWFISHLYFEDIPETGYFKIVRSKTAPGVAIDPIVTRLPNDDPGVKHVYYRLKKIHGTIKRKTHIVYPLSHKKLERIDQLFYQQEWSVESQPGYTKDSRVNPFTTFSAIPADSRYRFLLDNAYHYVLTFIRGPVCRGQNALNAINDNFYIVFQNPDSPSAMTNKNFMHKNNEHLKLPGNIMSLIGFPLMYNRITAERNSYLNNQRQYLEEHYSSTRSIGLNDIWMGNSKASTPLLTVYRHFDTASLLPGFVGSIPDTAWVIDYPLLERIYYSLVVNFDIFSPVAHQAATRRYFDLLRHEAENNFLHYLPSSTRQDLQNSWYRGVILKGLLDYHKPSNTIKTGVAYETDNPKKEFLDKVEAMIGRHEALHSNSSFFRVVEDIPASAAPFLQFFPEVIYARVVHSEPDSDEVFTLLRNKEHTNVAYIFGEESRREPHRDSLHIVRGITGDYPNFILILSNDEIATFQQEVFSARSKTDIDSIALKYGILRNSPGFWEQLEWFQKSEERKGHYHMGIFDLKNYIIY